MKLFILIAFILNLQANDFPLLQPISIEKAPLEHIVSTKKEEPIVEKTVQKALEETDNKQNTNVMLLKINFQANSTKISENSTAELEEFSNYLLKNKSYQVVIYAYTDSSEKKEDNRILSQKRANKIIEFIEHFGVSSTRLTAIGMGEKNPIADNDTAQGRIKNRRIEALIIK